MERSCILVRTKQSEDDVIVETGKSEAQVAKEQHREERS